MDLSNMVNRVQDELENFKVVKSKAKNGIYALV